MAETPSQSADTNTPKAVKDKNCPFCGQAFTSSSLGRHLDLYIKEKNPKQPDGVHDVAEIRKLRGNITRRQPRGSLARRATSTPTGTRAASVAGRSPVSDDGDSSAFRTPAARKDSAQGEEPAASRYPFITPWEATGVINDIPKNGELRRADSEGSAWPSNLQPQRAVSRQMQKAQFDMKQKVQDALDTARAAELALREIMGSWRAAKYVLKKEKKKKKIFTTLTRIDRQHIDMHSMPFDFEPLALDFPALTLQCLEPPPTLFSSTQHPTPSSWSIAPPGHQQCEALRNYFTEEFRKWRNTCESMTTAVDEDLPYPPSATVLKSDAREAGLRGLRVAESLERQVSNHIDTTFALWEGLPAERRCELWVLELARSVGKKQHEIDRLKETQHSLRQETTNLKSHVEHLNRLQQPREFKILSPTTVPVPRDLVAYMQGEAVVHGRRTIGLSLDDRHSDLGTMVATAVDRWKNIIVSTRSTNALNAQRPLDQPTSATGSQAGATPTGTNDGDGSAGAVNNIPAGPQGQASQLQNHPPVPVLQDPPRPRQHNFASGANGGTFVPTSTGMAPVDHRPQPTTQGGGTPAIVTTNAGGDDEMSDQDADAEMEDDDTMGFHTMNNTATRQVQQQLQLQEQARQQAAAMPAQQTSQLNVPRTRGATQQRFAPNGNAGELYAASPGHVNHGAGMGMSRSASPMNAAGRAHVVQQQAQLEQGAGGGYGHGRVAQADMGMTMQGVGEPMYTD